MLSMSVSQARYSIRACKVVTVASSDSMLCWLSLPHHAQAASACTQAVPWKPLNPGQEMRSGDAI
jgi:hypothetical protein